LLFASVIQNYYEFHNGANDRTNAKDGMSTACMVSKTTDLRRCHQAKFLQKEHTYQL